MTSSARSGITALTLTGILWGSIGVVVRLLQDAGVPTLSIAFWRLACACVVLVPPLGATGLRSCSAAPCSSPRSPLSTCVPRRARPSDRQSRMGLEAPTKRT